MCTLMTDDRLSTRKGVREGIQGASRPAFDKPTEIEICSHCGWVGQKNNSPAQTSSIPFLTRWMLVIRTHRCTISLHCPPHKTLLCSALLCATTSDATAPSLEREGGAGGMQGHWVALRPCRGWSFVSRAGYRGVGGRGGGCASAQMNSGFATNSLVCC